MSFNNLLSTQFFIWVVSLVWISRGRVLAIEATTILTAGYPRCETVTIQFHAFRILTSAESVVVPLLGVSHFKKFKLKQFYKYCSAGKYTYTQLIFILKFNSNVKIEILYYSLSQQQFSIIYSLIVTLKDEISIRGYLSQLKLLLGYYNFLGFFNNLKYLFIIIQKQKKKMPQFFTLPYFQQQCAEYDPYFYAYAVGEVCKTCRQRILHNECISACSCYRYSHEKCLVADLNSFNQDKEQMNFKCKTCQKMLGVRYLLDVKTKPHLTKFNIFLLLLALIWLPLVIYSMIINRSQPIIVAFHSFMITFLISILGYAVINTFMVKQYTLANIKSTQLGLMISAFADLQKQLSEQTTNTQIMK